MFRFRDLLEQRQQALAQVITREHGKLLSDALGPALTRSMLYGRAKSIWGGSNEIQHNVIAKRVLGL